MKLASSGARALAAGAICLGILGGMMVGHEWPLWTGRTIVLPVRASDSRGPLRGERVHLQTPGTRVVVSNEGGVTVPPDAVLVRPAKGWPRDLPDDPAERRRHLRGAVVYLQFEPRTEGNVEYRPVSISRRPVDDAINIRGRIYPIGDEFHVVLGLDTFHVQEGTAARVADALQQRQEVQMEVAVTDSGRTRIRSLLIDGVPFGS